MASPDMLADRAARLAARPKPVCGSCGADLPGPGTCRVCFWRADRKVKARPIPGTRHLRRRAAGVSRSKAGR